MNWGCLLVSEAAKFVKMLIESGNFYLVLGSCISADSNYSVESCEKNIEVLKMLKEGIIELGLLEEYQDYFNNAFQICERDRDMYD